MRIPDARHVTNVEVYRRTTGCKPLSDLAIYRRLQCFGHLLWAVFVYLFISKTSVRKDHHRLVAAVLQRPPHK